jgi:hypothetical protein
MDPTEILVWSIVAFFAILSMTFLFLWIFTPTTETCQTQAQSNPKALIFSCGNGQLPVQSSSVTLNYCIANAPSFSFAQALMQCGQATQSSDPAYQYFHSSDGRGDRNIDVYANWYQGYLAKCGGGWTLDPANPYPLPSPPQLAVDVITPHIAQCQTNNLT